MITMLKHYRLQNLQDELAELEKKIIKNAMKSKTIDIYDLKELEGLSNKIAFLIANVND